MYADARAVAFTSKYRCSGCVQWCPLRVATLAAMVTVTPARAAESPESLYDLTVMQYGKPTPLAAYRGKVSVVVNVASE